jgi:hypothetical protein
MESLLRDLLVASTPAHDTLPSWWIETRAAREAHSSTADRALAGGVLADRLGFAFAAGYQEALRALVGHARSGSAGPRSTPAGSAEVVDGIAALCVTEARGNMPKDIETTLTPDGDGFVLSGKKKWATAAPLATALLVCAKSGVDEQGRNRLRMVNVSTRASGLTLTASSAPFVPEIPHAEVTLDNVRVAATSVLPGDGYSEYVKPFRTVEDAHVHAALLGYLIGVARRHEFDPSLIEQLVSAALSVRAIALADPKSSSVHIALAGAITHVTQLVSEVERAWSQRTPPGDEHGRWQRDRPLLKVAGAARAARREAAWTSLRAR